MKIVLLPLLCLHAIAAMADCSHVVPAGYELAMSVDWKRGMPVWAGVQAPTPRSVSIRKPQAENGAMLHVEVDRSDSFVNVASGTPRVEVLLGRTRFLNGMDYRIEWSTLLPRNFELDTKQPEIITQIHQGAASGSPPFALLINNNHYELNVRSDRKGSLRVFRFGKLKDDLGRRVCWSLRYVPGTGKNAVTEFYKDGHIIFAEHGRGNAYSNDKEAYLKVGIYKWLWMSTPSDVTHREMDFGNVLMYRRRDSDPQVLSESLR